MRSISVLFFFCPSPILFQRVLLPFIHHLVNLASFCCEVRLCHCLGRIWIIMANWFMLNGVSDLVGQFPHDCCPTQRERVSVNPQSHAFSEDIQVLKTLHSTTIYIFFNIRDFKVLSLFLLLILPALKLDRKTTLPTVTL